MPDNFSAPAIKYQQGGRSAYSFAMSLEDLHRILPIRQQDDLSSIQGVNRAIAPRHANGIRNYLRETADWVLGTIIIATKAEFAQFDGQAITLAAEHFNEVRIIDGQHRRKAIGDLLDQLQEPEQRQRILTNQISVSLYEVNSEREMRQMFAWLANNKPIDANTKRQFDTSNPFNNVADLIAEQSSLLADRVGRNRAKTANASEWLLTVPEIAELVVVTNLGYGTAATLSLQRSQRPQPIQDAMYQRTMTFFDEFLPKVHPVIRDILDNKVPNPHIAIRRVNTWALDPTVIKFMANCFEQMQPEPWQPLAQHLGALNLDRDIVLGDSDLHQMNLVDPATNRFVAARDPQWRKIAKQICSEARNHTEENTTAATPVAADEN